MRSYWYALRRFDRNIWYAFVLWSAIAFGYFGIAGVLLNLYLIRLGYGPSFIGQLMGSGQLIWAVFALPAGAIGMRVGLKRAMVIAMLIESASFFLLLAAEVLPPNLRSQGLFLGWMVTWIGAALVTVNGIPYLMAVTDVENRRFVFAAQQAIMSLMAFAGSLVAGAAPGLLAGVLGVTLDDPAPFRLALLLAPLTYLVGGLVFSRARPAMQLEETTVEAASARRMPFGMLTFILVIVFLQSFGDGAVRSFFNVYLDTDLLVSTASIGAIMGSGQLLPVLVAFATPAMLNRWGTVGGMLLATLGAALFMLLIGGVPTWAAAALAFIGLLSTSSFINTSRSIFSQETVSVRWRTTSSAIMTIGMALGWASSSWLGGSLAGEIGFRSVFSIGAVLTLIAVALILVYNLRAARAKRIAGSTISIKPGEE